MRNDKSSQKPALKQTRVQLWLRPDQKEIIARAAQLHQTTLSNFIRENAYRAAQQVLVGEVPFVLPPERWQAFCRALDDAPRDIPALKKLLTEASIFEGQGAAS